MPNGAKKLQTNSTRVLSLCTHTLVSMHTSAISEHAAAGICACVCGLNIYLLKDRWICQEWWKSFCQPLPPLPPVVFTDWMQSAVRHARDHFIRVQHVLDDEEIWERTLRWNLPLAERLLCVVGTGCSRASAGFADRTYSNKWCKLCRDGRCWSYWRTVSMTLHLESCLNVSTSKTIHFNIRFELSDMNELFIVFNEHQPVHTTVPKCFIYYYFT